MNRKGIILAGGKGTRLYPITKSFPKCLLPIYDKPMIYYSVSTLMLAGIKDILIITTPEDSKRFMDLLGDGKELGIRVSYEIQPKPEGIAQALIIGEKFIDGHPSALMLGDNIFHGKDFYKKLKEANESNNNTIFCIEVPDPERFGICELDKNQRVISLEEKPIIPKSKLAVTGLYFYDSNAAEYAKKVKRSVRGELEITDLNIMYMKQNNLFAQALYEDFIWIDAGTVNSFLDAGNIVKKIQTQNQEKISCLEKIAFESGFISAKQVTMLAKKYPKGEYSEYIEKLVKQ